MSYATYHYADILNANLRTLRSKSATEILAHISEPLIDSIEIIKERIRSASLYELMNFAGAIRLYEQGRKGFYFPDVRSTVKNEIAKNKMDTFYSFNKLYTGFDNLIKGGTFVQDPSGRKKYTLNKGVQEELDKILQNQRKSSLQEG
jgi:hypothetical protein